MNNEEKRRCCRIALPSEVQLCWRDEPERWLQVINLSVNGIYVHDERPVEQDQLYALELVETSAEPHWRYLVLGRVVRHKGKEIALAFIDMSEEALLFIQNTLLHSVEDPFAVAKQFEEIFSPPLC